MEDFEKIRRKTFDSMVYISEKNIKFAQKLPKFKLKFRLKLSYSHGWSKSKHMSEQEVDADAEWRGILGDAAQKLFLPQIHHFDGAREAIQ